MALEPARAEVLESVDDAVGTAVALINLSYRRIHGESHQHASSVLSLQNTGLLKQASARATMTVKIMRLLSKFIISYVPSPWGK